MRRWPCRGCGSTSFNPLLIGAGALPVRQFAYMTRTGLLSFNPLLIGAGALLVVIAVAELGRIVSIPF